MKVKLNNVLMISFFILVFNCKNENVVEKEIANVEVAVSIERFDKILPETELKDLDKVREVFPFLFPKEIDSVWLQRLNSDIQKQVFSEVSLSFQDLSTQKLELKNFFRHLTYYDKSFSVPRIITVADYVDFRNKLIVESDLLIVNLSNYLGQNHEFYQNIPVYFAENMRSSQIVPDIAGKYARRYNYQSQRKTFLDEIIFYGKELYFKDVMIPDFSDAEKIGYTKNDIEWSKINEDQIWSYFVEKEYLYSTDPKLFSRFTTPAPFSKFYLDIDNESPGRLGQFIGWQIVRAYAERTGADILALMKTDADIIFKNSKYKPKR